MHAYARFGSAVLVAVAVAVAGALPALPDEPAGMPVQRLIYAAQDDGTLHVYDVDQQHAEIKAMRVFACCGDVRGIAAGPNARVLVMYNQANEGHVAALDALSDTLLWDRVFHSPGVDRG